MAALRKEVAELRATTPRIHINGAPQAPLGAFPMHALQMPPYPYQATNESGIWHYPQSASGAS